MAYENITVETRGKVGLVTLNRPKALNALCAALIEELAAALDDLEAADDVAVIILTGSEKAFCAGEIGRATSELQSLMRISYAVFCLKKKKIKYTYKHQSRHQ